MDLYIFDRHNCWGKDIRTLTAWKSAQFTVQSVTGYQLLFEGIVGGVVLGDIALDDLSFVNGQCKTSPSKARPASLSTTVPPTTAATTPIVTTSVVVQRAKIVCKVLAKSAT